MSAVDVLAELRARGVKITARPGGKLGLRGPARVVAELRDEVRAHKAELVAFLHESSRTGAAERDDGQAERSVSQSHPAPARKSATAQIHPDIAAELERIEAEALRLGWTRDRLRNVGFWRPWPRGLASVLETGDRITEINSDYITVRKGDGHGATQRFWKSH